MIFVLQNDENAANAAKQPRGRHMKKHTSESPAISHATDAPSRITNVSIEHHAMRKPSAHATDSVQCEDSLTIRLDGCDVCRVSCSFDHVSELAMGHLLTQGFIASADDVENVSVDEANAVANVTLAADRRSEKSSYAKSNCITTSSAQLLRTPSKPIEPFGLIQWDESWIYTVSKEFALDKTSHYRTRGCHSAYLANKDGILVMREDIGRHNAFDKVVGWALFHNVNLGECLLYTSGRVPTDMVLKAIRARIPILVSKSVTTDKAVGVARSVGLVLVCEARPESFELVSGNGPDSIAQYAEAI